MTCWSTSSHLPASYWCKKILFAYNTFPQFLSSWVLTSHLFLGSSDGWSKGPRKRRKERMQGEERAHSFTSSYTIAPEDSSFNGQQAATMGHPPRLLLSLRRRCLLTKQAASVLNKMAAARKQMVATMPATTGLARPSSTMSGGGKKSEGDRGANLQGQAPARYHHGYRTIPRWQTSHALHHVPNRWYFCSNSGLSSRPESLFSFFDIRLVR